MLLEPEATLPNSAAAPPSHRILFTRPGIKADTTPAPIDSTSRTARARCQELTPMSAPTRRVSDDVPECDDTDRHPQNPRNQITHRILRRRQSKASAILGCRTLHHSLVELPLQAEHLTETVEALQHLLDEHRVAAIAWRNFTGSNLD